MIGNVVKTNKNKSKKPTKMIGSQKIKKLNN